MFDHVPRLLVELLRLTAWLAIVSVTLVPLEQLFHCIRRRSFASRSRSTSAIIFSLGSPPGSMLQPRSPSSPTLPGSWSQTQFWRRSQHGQYGCALRLRWWSGKSAIIGGTVQSRSSASMALPRYPRQRGTDRFPCQHRAHPVDFVFTRICMLTPLYALGLVGTVHVTDGAIAMAVLLAGIVGDTSCMRTCGGGSDRWNGSSPRQVSTTGTTRMGCSAIATTHRCCRGSIAFLARITCRRFGRRDMES